MGIIIKDKLGPNSRLTLACSGVEHTFDGDGSSWIPNASELNLILHGIENPGRLYFADPGSSDRSYIQVEDNKEYVVSLQVKSSANKK